MFSEGANRELIGALSGMAGVDPLPTRVLTVRALGPRASPRDERSGEGWVNELQHQRETVRNTVNALGGDTSCAGSATSIGA